MKNHRFHVYLGSKRTTVSLDPLLVALISLNQGITPETAESHSAVRRTLQQHLERFPDEGRIHVSQWLKGEVVLSLVDKKLSKGYLEWLEGHDETIVAVSGDENTQYDHTPMKPHTLDGERVNYSPTPPPAKQKEGRKSRKLKD